jgi:predicted metal-dependent HD superfamily phosphohydrolase
MKRMLYTNTEIRQVLQDSGLKDLLPEKLLLLVAGLYGDETRHYHDFDHAIEVVSWANRACEEYSEEALVPFTHQELRLAALFHDIIYTTAGTPANETLSCGLMRRELAGLIPEESLDRINQLIMFTAQHGQLDAADVPLAGQVLMDCDIANMGQYHWEVFVYNNKNVVEELRLKYTPEQIEVGRKAFLAGLLAKESIFLSEFFRSRFEDQARRNLTKVLANS